MKLIHFVPTAALAALLVTGCDRKSPDVASQLGELERKANEAADRQRELEQQIEDQKLAAERDAIERERMEIEAARAELERNQDDAAAAEAERLRQREIELANREGKVELLQSRLDDEAERLQQRDQQLSKRDRELAGREALASENDEETINEPAVPVGDYGMFHDSLSSYGSWFETSDYGYVWQPAIVRDSSWRPYTRGRWACTDRGWTWISDEPFGWATYHYGRWALCRGYGWIWVPGSDWAPSWVSWRSSGSHIGWAPLPPETLAYRSHRWDSTVDVTCGIAASWFNFVEIGNFGMPIHHHCLPYTQNGIYIGKTVNITNIHISNRRVICGGPSYGDIERQTKRRPPFYRIEEERPGRPGRDSASMRPRIEGNRLKVSAPNLDAAWNEGLKPGKIKGRMESINVERQQELRPEVTERVLQSREENRRKAEQSITELGGKENFKVRRIEQLDQNRSKVEATQRTKEKTPASRPRKEEGKTPTKTEPANKRETAPQIVAPKDRSQVTEEALERVRKQRDETATQPGTQEDRPRIVAPRDRSQVTDEAKERVRKQREEAESQPGKREDGPRFSPPSEVRPQVQEDNNARMRKQQEEQAEQNQRQQQETQREQARQQQIAETKREQARQLEEAKREQARQQQIEETKREQARQQQIEETKREQARQQEMEEVKREQARQQEMEEARREQAREQARQQQQEQARQQQQEESRREQARQQQQQEESRREQARQQQQQEESQRQERSRQERQEEERRQKNR